MKKILLVSLILVVFSLEILASQKMKVAIMDFDSRDRASSSIVRTMMNPRRSDFVTLFEDHEIFELIDLRTSADVLKKSGISNLVFASRDEIIELGNDLNADILIWGEVSEQSATELRIRASVLSMRTGNISQYSFNTAKRTSDRVIDIRKNLIDEIQELAVGEINRIFRIAEQHFNNNNYPSARDSFLRVIELDPNNLDAYFYLGYIFFLMNDFEQSEEYYLMGLEIDPEEATILNNLAETQRRMDQPYKAIETLKRLAEIEDNDLVWLRIGDMYIELDYFTEARHALERALEINDQSEASHYRLGILFFDYNYFNESIPHLEFISELHPEDDLINRRLTTAYMRTGKLENAIESYIRQIERNPENVTAHLNLAGAYRTLDRNREALNTLNDLMSIEPNNPTVRIRMADALIALNRLNEAQTHANTALELLPDSHEPYLLLAQIEQIRGYAKYDEFINLEEKARESFGREADRLIDQRDEARSDANRLFKNAMTHLNTAYSKTVEPAVQRDINGRRQTLNPLIQETERTFFD